MYPTTPPPKGTTMKKLVIILAMALAATLGSAVPAQAGWIGGEAAHASDDTGYLGRQNAIWVHCNSGIDAALYRGQNSAQVWDCSDVDWIYAFPEERIVCFEQGGVNRIEIYYPGRNVGNFEFRKCYAQLR